MFWVNSIHSFTYFPTTANCIEYGLHDSCAGRSGQEFSAIPCATGLFGVQCLRGIQPKALVNERSQVFVFQHFNFLDFVRSTEKPLNKFMNGMLDL